MALSKDPSSKPLGSFTGVLFVIGRWRFAPGLASTLAALSLVPILLCLAYWQWQRFHIKNADLQNLQTHKHLLTRTEANILHTENTIQDLQHGYGSMIGACHNEQVILVDNQILQGQAGYTVLTPLRLESPIPLRHRLILVDRGWIPRGSQPHSLPNIPPVLGPVHLKGRLYPPMQPFRLPSFSKASTAHTKPSWPLRVLWVDLQNLEQALGYPLYPLILRLESGDPHGFESLPLVQPGGTPALKHLGYALQWFMMALAVLIYYVVINTKDCEKPKSALLRQSD